MNPALKANTSLSIRLTPVLSKDANGRATFDNKNGVTTTVDYVGAAALYIAAGKIVDGEKDADSLILRIDCQNDKAISLVRNADESNGKTEQMDTVMYIHRRDITIPFVFATHQYQVNENGQVVIKVIHSELAAFAKIVEGYLLSKGAAYPALDKMPENFNEINQACQQAPYAVGNDKYSAYYNNSMTKNYSNRNLPSWGLNKYIRYK